MKLSLSVWEDKWLSFEYVSIKMQAVQKQTKKLGFKCPAFSGKVNLVFISLLLDFLGQKHYCKKTSSIPFSFQNQFWLNIYDYKEKVIYGKCNWEKDSHIYILHNILQL